MSNDVEGKPTGGADARSQARIRVRVQPGAPRSEVVGFLGEVLRVKVAAPPQRGKANDALVELLARTLGVPRSQVRVLKGHTSRDKLILVENLSLEQVLQQLGGP